MLSLPPQVHTALLRLRAEGWDAYAVGGCVRDLLMGREPGDYDVATAAPPAETERVFASERVIETGLKHGTVTVLLDDMPIEITTFREEGGYSDGRHPDAVRFTSDLLRDLSRRDFTVNAMAYNEREGLVDPFGGREDLNSRVIRCVGNPDARFLEDGLRILRALRFASTLGFSVGTDTEAALRRNRETLRKISAERIFSELCQLMCGRDVRKILTGYPEVLGVAVPELLPMVEFDQRNEHHIYDVLTHTAVTVEHMPPDRVLRLAALLHDIGKPDSFTVDEQGVGHFYGHPQRSGEMADAILRRLRCDNAARERIVLLVREHDRPIEGTEPAVKRVLNRLTPEVFFELLTLKRADNLAQNPKYRGRQEEYDRLEEIAQRILDRQACFSLKDLAVNGNDLRAAGMAPGKAMGAALEGLLEAVMNGEAENEKEALLALAKERYL